MITINKYCPSKINNISIKNTSAPSFTGAKVFNSTLKAPSDSIKDALTLADNTISKSKYIISEKDSAVEAAEVLADSIKSRLTSIQNGLYEAKLRNFKENNSDNALFEKKYVFSPNAASIQTFREKKPVSITNFNPNTLEIESIFYSPKKMPQGTINAQTVIRAGENISCYKGFSCNSHGEITADEKFVFEKFNGKLRLSKYYKVYRETTDSYSTSRAMYEFSKDNTPDFSFYKNVTELDESIVADERCDFKDNKLFKRYSNYAQEPKMGMEYQDELEFLNGKISKYTRYGSTSNGDNGVVESCSFKNGRIQEYFDGNRRFRHTLTGFKQII